MPTIMFDAKGLLEGRRLRRLSTKARLYYPIYSAESPSTANLPFPRWWIVFGFFCAGSVQALTTSRTNRLNLLTRVQRIEPNLLGRDSPASNPKC